MQQPVQMSWDGIYGRLDLATKLTVLYLAASWIALPVFVIRSAIAFWQPISNLQDVRVSSLLQIRLRAMSRWMRLTVLILLVYSAFESLHSLGAISTGSAIGSRVIAGTMGRILSIWAVGLWLLVALWIADSIFSRRLARSNSLQQFSSR
jgi:hypothetical protein